MAYAHRLNDDEKEELLRIARATLREYLRTGRAPPGKPHRNSLVANAGAFVTLHTGRQLRGCIGTLLETSPLYRTIQEMVIAAAARDPRFEPVRAEELDHLTIEISVLGDRQRITDASQIEVGTHGLTIDYRGHRGLLLPQVASEHGWDALTFLDHVCAKAGLPAGAWRQSDSALETFTAQVFNEDTYPPEA
jgi:AmmeMemoRadiSam system protein A